jgi:hypothetical protein
MYLYQLNYNYYKKIEFVNISETKLNREYTSLLQGSFNEKNVSSPASGSIIVLT